MDTMKMFQQDDEQKRHDTLLANIKAHLPELENLVGEFHSNEEDGIYRFYHQSFKVFQLQPIVRRARDLFNKLSPDAVPLHQWFSAICEGALDREFDSGRTNDIWLDETRPLLEAFWHCRYFTENLLRYGRELDKAPYLLPSGWAALLCLFNMR